MHSSVEVRYPFLDEDVFDFTAKLHPNWKLRGFRDKHLLRLLAERWLPPQIARRSKVIFRAPLDSFHMDPEPKFVAELLSEESLRRTGYFDIAGGATLAERLPQDARRLAAAPLGGDGPVRRRRDAALASHIHRRLACRPAHEGGFRQHGAAALNDIAATDVRTDTSDMSTARDRKAEGYSRCGSFRLTAARPLS